MMPCAVCTKHARLPRVLVHDCRKGLFARWTGQELTVRQKDLAYHYPAVAYREKRNLNHVLLTIPNTSGSGIVLTAIINNATQGNCRS
eukprot:4817998-Pleurochrysis_carterae.AAC.1